MNEVLTRLTAWGCDVPSAMERMADDEEFYVECLQEVAEDPYFDTLKEALDAGDLRKAFDAAHTLKGVLANVGLTPMYDKIVEIVEPLRGGHQDHTMERYAELIAMRQRLRDILAGA